MRCPVSSRQWARGAPVFSPAETFVRPLDHCGNCPATREIGRGMAARGSGKIIFIASLPTFQGGINVPVYAASKGGIGQLTMAFANEWASLGVNVNAIAPGYINTDNTEALRNDPDRSRSILDRIPAGRRGVPEDFGGPAVFLASAASDYKNGHVMTVDGGWMGR